MKVRVVKKVRTVIEVIKVIKVKVVRKEIGVTFNEIPEVQL